MLARSSDVQGYVLTHKLSAVVVEVGNQVRHKIDRKAGLRTIVGVVGDSNPPVLVVDLQSFRFQISKHRKMCNQPWGG